MPSMMITEILRNIKENLPVDIQEQYKNIFIAKNVTSILEAQGILSKSAGGGRLPTQAGNDLGIFTESRTNYQARENYIQVLYSEAAADYVRNLLFTEYPEINPDAPNGYTITTYPALTGSGRRTVNKICADYNVEIALCRHHDKYWTYDETAITLCRILGTAPHHAAGGKVGVAIDCNTFCENAIPVLEENGLDFAINDEQLKIFKKVARPLPITASTVAKVGNAITLRDSDGEILNVYLAKGEKYTFQSITSVNGQIEIIRVPITTINEYMIIHPETPLFNEIVGKREGEIIRFNGFEYEIIKIKNASL